MKIDGSEQEPVELIIEDAVINFNKGDVINITFRSADKTKYRIRTIEYDLDQWFRNGKKQTCLDKITIYLEEI